MPDPVPLLLASTSVRLVRSPPPLIVALHMSHAYSNEQKRLVADLTATATAGTVAGEVVVTAVATAARAAETATETATVTAMTAPAAPEAMAAVAATGATTITTEATTAAMIVAATATTVAVTIAEVAVAVTTTTEVASTDTRVVAVTTATEAPAAAVPAEGSIDTNAALTVPPVVTLLPQPVVTATADLAPKPGTRTVVCTILTPVTVETEFSRCSLSNPTATAR